MVIVFTENSKKCEQDGHVLIIVFVENQKIRDKLLKVLDEKYNMYCAYGYANPQTLYMCMTALMDPEKYGKKLAYSSRKYPEGLCPKAEKLLTRSFLIPFNENFTQEEIDDIGKRLIMAVKEVCLERVGL